MTDTIQHDCIIIGAGPGGYVAAIRAAALGLDTAIIEKREAPGGTCLNVGCIPAKALLDSTDLLVRARDEASEHGIVTGEVHVDLPAMLKRKESIVNKLTSGVRQLLDGNGVTVYHGTGRVDKQGTVSVTEPGGETKLLSGDSIVLATGSTPVELPFIPFDGKKVIDSTGAMELKKIPGKMLIIGAGAIGLEMGSVWSRMGTEVTIIEVAQRILPFSDRQVASTLRRVLKKQGLAIMTGTKVIGYSKKKDGVSLEIENEKGDKSTLSGDVVLVAAGRRPVIDKEAAEKNSIKLNSMGRFEVDSSFQTSVPGIYAIGDVIAGPMLAHKAEDEGFAVAEIIAGKQGHVNYKTIPSVVYTWPELASVGLTEEQAKDQGITCSAGSFFFAANGRAMTSGSTDGMVKLVTDSKTDKLLGAHIVGPWASDLIQELVTAMEFSASSEDVARIVHSHPTLSEVVREAALDACEMPLHKLSRKK
jgi:dihydrolipoamide dehydrogenase